MAPRIKAPSPYHSGYEGARYFKCDLQMGTPADGPHWQGTPMGSDETSLAQAAEGYVKRCYETGLEIIAITDHNFASKTFISLLKKEIQRQKAMFGYEMVLFPGFEIEADVGKGLHALAIFAPDTSLEDIDHILTECGVAPPRFSTQGAASKSTLRLPEILKVVQRKDANGIPRGIVICPHALTDAGIFDSERISDWLQTEEFTNPDLLAIEVPKPPASMSSSWQKLLGAGPSCLELWRRNRSIACIMSSDAKALDATSGAANFIGFRHTWIKMSDPSIESLRQAFLDHGSRIRLQETRPEDSYAFPQISRIWIQGAAFLSDEEIILSPNLNAVIGGRGTGKSTVVEYLRVALDQESSIRGQEPKTNFENLKSTLSDASTIVIEFLKEGAKFTAESMGAGKARILGDSGHLDLSRLFPVQILSQREVSAIATNRDARRRLVDDVIRSKLENLGQQEADIVSRIGELDVRIRTLPALLEREKALETEKKEVELRLEKLKSLEGPLAKLKGLQAELRFVDSTLLETSQVVERIKTTFEEIAFAPHVRLAATSGENQALIQSLVASVDSELDALKKTVLVALERFDVAVNDRMGGEDVVAFKEAARKYIEEFQVQREELAKQGTDPDKYLAYQAELDEKIKQLLEIRQRIAEIDALRKSRDGDGEDGSHGLLGDLEAIWKTQFEARTGAALHLTNSVPKTNTGEPFVKISIVKSGDKQGFGERMASERQHRGRINDDDWGTLANAIFGTSSACGASPTALFVKWIEELKTGSQPAGYPWAADDRKSTVLIEWLTSDRLSALRVWKTPDRVKVELLRQDGSLVGELEGKELSLGQRCTAVLAILIAQDSIPIIVDQPEEDLDNEFIFHELVPLLRKVKESRQIIVVSHNANIPVNADAELVVALEVKDKKGTIRVRNGQTASGGLDKSQVKRAVEDIMEGSEEAFRRRFEKYGF